ncbi:MAG: hypothetical protein Q9179_006394 [Wetmoreana sp. 5 TL-2023]
MQDRYAVQEYIKSLNQVNHIANVMGKTTREGKGKGKVKPKCDHCGKTHPIEKCWIKHPPGSRRMEAKEQGNRPADAQKSGGDSDKDSKKSKLKLEIICVTRGIALRSSDAIDSTSDATDIRRMLDQLNELVRNKVSVNKVANKPLPHEVIIDCGATCFIFARRYYMIAKAKNAGKVSAQPHI